ncbi:MAG TPA: M17 family peptidase N-terminal domain-containing protein, partial [Tahibacter sp.]|nr:M17 family peptidase N-terminal domain-containing protein [Tahibacter sp.]
MTIQFSATAAAPETVDTPCVVVGVYEEKMLTGAAARIDEASGGAIRRLIDAGDISGKLGTSHVLFALAGVAAPRVVVVGLGES